MRRLRSILRALTSSLRRGRLDRDLHDELAFHLDARRADLERQGLTPEAARRRARLEFGSTEGYKERMRDERRAVAVEHLLRDVAYAWRSLRRSPGLVLVAVLSLGLGIGVNATLFAAVRAIFFHLPSAADPDRVVGVEPGNSNQFSYLNYRDLRERGLFADVAGSRLTSVRLRAGDAIERPSALVVTANFFTMLGVSARAGRLFTQEDSAPERDVRTVVLSHAYWRSRFDGDLGAIGRRLELNGEPFVVIGVLPADYRPVTGALDPSLYVPVSALTLPNLHARPNGSNLEVLARLRDGVTTAQAQAAVTTFGQEMERVYPRENEGFGRPARLFPLRGLQMRGAPDEAYLLPVVLALFFGLLLLIACANVAGLLLARAAGRRREVAVRVALGASRWRVIQGPLAESLVLALLGAAAGVVLATWILGLLTTYAPLGGGLRVAIRSDVMLYLFAAGTALVTGVICGLVPAWRATRASVAAEIQHGAGGGSTPRLWLRHAFVIGQVAASLVLLVVSSLFLRSLQTVAALDPGFDLAQSLVVKLDVDPATQPSAAGSGTSAVSATSAISASQATAATGPTTSSASTASTGATAATAARLLIAERVLQRIEQLPGVRSAALAGMVPLGGDSNRTRFTVGDSAQPGASTWINQVGPRYFETLGIRVLRGREFLPSDRAGAPPVVIVNEAFARSYFPGQEALGRRLGNRRGEPDAEIVGIVGDHKVERVSESFKPALYHPYAQRPGRLMVQIRLAGAPATAPAITPAITSAITSASTSATAPAIAPVIANVKRAIADLDPGILVEVQTMRDATSLELTLRGAASLLLGTLGALGLFLSLIGLYGVIAHVVASRTTEIGIRMALGASARRVRWGVLREGLRLVSIGIAIGGGLALLLARPLTAVLAGLSPADPIALGGTALIVLSIGLAAMWLPARRATRVDPTIALRNQ